MTAIEQARLERVARWYTNRTGVSALSGQVAARYICEHATPGGAMLEMGCGKGAVTEILAEKFPGLHVVEGSETNCRMVRSLLNGRVRVFRSLFEEWKPTQRYDDIVMGRMLGHVKDPDMVLGRAVCWLKPGGHIHIVVPNAESLHRRIGVAMGMLTTVYSQSQNDVAVGQRRVYDSRSLRALVERANLKVVALRGTLLKPLDSVQLESLPDRYLEGLYEVAKELPPELTAELYACCEVA